MIWMEEGCKGRKERKGRKGKEGKEGREGRKRGKGGKEGRKGKARKGKERKGRKEKEGKEGKEGKEKKGREGRKGRKGRGRRKGPLACGQWVGRTARARVCGWAGGRRGDVKRWKRGAHAPGLRLLSRETRSTVSTVGGVVGEMRPSLSPSLGGEAVAVDASLGSHSARIRLSVNHSAIACRSTSRLPRSARSARARSSANLCSSAACVCCVRAGSRKVGRAVRKSVDRSSIARRWCDACAPCMWCTSLRNLDSAVLDGAGRGGGGGTASSAAPRSSTSSIAFVSRSISRVVCNSYCINARRRRARCCLVSSSPSTTIVVSVCVCVEGGGDSRARSSCCSASLGLGGAI